MGSESSTMRSTLHPSHGIPRYRSSSSLSSVSVNHSGRLSPNLHLPALPLRSSSKFKSKSRRSRLPPRIIDRILSIVLAQAFEEDQYRRALRYLKSVNREIRNLTIRQTMVNVYISSSSDIQHYERIIHDHYPPPPSEDPPPDYEFPPFHPRDLAKTLTIKIGGQRYNYYAERSILNFVSEADLSRLLTYPYLSRNLEWLRLEFRRGHPDSVTQIIAGMPVRSLKGIVIRCGEPEGGCREVGCLPCRRCAACGHEDDGSAFIPASAASPYTSLTHLTLSCTSTSLANTLFAHTPNLMHVRLTGAYGALPTLVQTAPRLKTVTLDLKNGKREYDAWNVGKALEEGLLSPISVSSPIPGAIMSPKKSHRISRSRSKFKTQVPQARSSGESKRAEATSDIGYEVDDAQQPLSRAKQQRPYTPGTLYLEGTNELTLRWRVDIAQVQNACKKYRVKLVLQSMAPPPPYSVA